MLDYDNSHDTLALYKGDFSNLFWTGSTISKWITYTKEKYRNPYLHIYFDHWLYVKQLKTNHRSFKNLHGKSSTPKILYRFIPYEKHPSLPKLFHESLFKYPKQNIPVYLQANRNRYFTKGKMKIIEAGFQYVLQLKRIKKLQNRGSSATSSYQNIPVYHKQIALKLYTYLISKLLKGDKTIQDIVARLPMSRGNLYPIFKNVIGVTPNVARRDRKLLDFVYDLITTDIPISNLYHETGYKSKSHFYRVFLATFEMSPNRFRKEFREIISNRL